MDKITPPEQKGGVEGRRMTDVIRNINETRNHNKDGYLILIDQTSLAAMRVPVCVSVRERCRIQNWSKRNGREETCFKLSLTGS